MAPNYAQLTLATMEKLPLNKKAEIYDFACFLKRGTSVRLRPFAGKSKKASILAIAGIGESDVKDAAKNHDNYLYE
jgi:hypothetical protein